MLMLTGTWKIPQPDTAGNVNDAFEAGFNHIDTAQAYRNEEQVGQALKECGCSRDEFWVTTKWSGAPWGEPTISVEESMANSLHNLGLDYVDLYLIHTPRLVQGNIQEGWKSMERLQKKGYAKNIGISNFKLDDLKELFGEHANASYAEKTSGPKILPAINQIELHPYVWKQQKEVVEYCQKKGIVIEAYSPLRPLTGYPGGPMDKPVNDIAKRLNIKPEQVLLAWAHRRGAVPLT